MNILNQKFCKHLRAYSFSAHSAIRFYHRPFWKLYNAEPSAFLALHPNSESKDSTEATLNLLLSSMSPKYLRECTQWFSINNPSLFISKGMILWNPNNTNWEKYPVQCNPKQAKDKGGDGRYSLLEMCCSSSLKISLSWLWYNSSLGGQCRRIIGSRPT